MKANHGRLGAQIALTWRNGVFVVDEPDTGLDRAARRSKAMRKFRDPLPPEPRRFRLCRASRGRGRH